ncbi:MAG TPA: RHS repeat domain-containing protein [Steroidobacteraceae bacterium]|nr:RHS repeat domain-containing protein [Steroidobacteraceae bacterium]
MQSNRIEFESRGGRRHRAARASARLGVVAIAALATAAAFAATTGYKYDALGRLIEVTHANGNVTTYQLDAAGNRSGVTETLGQAAPATISVPPQSATGSYTVSWTAGGTVTGYELYESAVSNFATSTKVFTGPGTSASLSGHGDGNFYYRVRGCAGSACTAFKTGGNAVDVKIAPGAPGSFSVPSTSNTGSFTVSWTSASGNVSTYKLYESTNSGFSPESNVYSNTGLSTGLTRTNGTYYYRVQACNGWSCGPNASGPNQTTVTIPPSTPGTMVVPSYNNTGSYSITWGDATGTVTAYELYEATNSSFTSPTLVFNQPTKPASLSGRGNNVYYYRVRACNGSQCSGYASGANQTTVTLSPSVPSSITVPSTNNTGNILVSWGTATGNVSAYQLWEATNSSFSGETMVYNLPGTSNTMLGRQNGSYWYHVRACNGAECSGFVAGGPTVVSNVAPPKPTGLWTNGNQNCSWQAGWDAMSGATYYIVRDRSGNFQYNVNAPATSKTYSYCGAPGYTGIPNDYRPKWVKACNAQACSVQTDYP